MPARTKSTRKRRDSYARCKTALDRVFSEYIRRRSVEADGFSTCVCCGARKPWRLIQAAHWVSRVHLATRWDARNVAPACSVCNVLKRGNMTAYAQYMLTTWGAGVMQELEALKHSTVKYRASDLQELIETYKKKVESLSRPDPKS